MLVNYVPLFLLFAVGGVLTIVFFVIFDVEAVFIYPWAIQFRSLGWPALLTMLSFLATLALALVYCWKKGALEWEK